jgi:hypothetical protein
MLLLPLHRWVWRDPHRCARKLLAFEETEADGGRDLARAAELTKDPLLRSGVPVLLNTSLNLAGEPIVNRAIEGYSTFRRSGIDCIVAGRTIVSKDGTVRKRENGAREDVEEAAQ